MTDHQLTPPPARPVGRIRWFGTPLFLYGVDSQGNVFRFEPSAPQRRRPGKISRWWKGLTA